MKESDVGGDYRLQSAPNEARGAVNACIICSRAPAVFQFGFCSLNLKDCIRHVWTLDSSMESDLLWRSLFCFLCSQVCAVVSLLPSGSLADLTCEALLMLSGNFSCKLRTNISWDVCSQTQLPAVKRQLYPRVFSCDYTSCAWIDFQAPNRRPQSQPSSVWLLAQRRFPLFCLCSTESGLLKTLNCSTHPDRAQPWPSTQEWSLCYSPWVAVIKMFQVAFNRLLLMMTVLCY